MTIEEQNKRTFALNEADRQFFAEAFTDPVSGEPYRMPETIKAAATSICRSYGIRGICDPMYIANVIAIKLGLGDGQSHFNP